MAATIRPAVLVIDPRPGWAGEFAALGTLLRSVLGDLATRIDHVGSTSVPGLPAKDVIDVQVSVATEEGLDAATDALGAAGYQRWPYDRDHTVPGLPADDGQWRKRGLGERPGERRANIHVRVEGRANQRYALLFRDYLRAHPASAEAYGRYKRLSAAALADPADYPDVKDPVCDLIYLPAEEWARRTGWRPGPSDA